MSYQSDLIPITIIGIQAMLMTHSSLIKPPGSGYARMAPCTEYDFGGRPTSFGEQRLGGKTENGRMAA